MVLYTEEEFNKFNKKIEIEMQFIYDYHYEEEVRYMFNIYYDSGNGLQYTILDKQTLEFATNVCKGKIEKYKKHIKPLYDNPYLSISSSPKTDLISDNVKRKSIANDLVSFASSMHVPVFLHTNDNYLLLNIDKIAEVENKETLDEYLEKEYHNYEYEYAKNSREKYKFKSKLEAKHKAI